VSVGVHYNTMEPATLIEHPVKKTMMSCSVVVQYYVVCLLCYLFSHWNPACLKC